MWGGAKYDTLVVRNMSLFKLQIFKEKSIFFNVFSFILGMKKP